MTRITQIAEWPKRIRRNWPTSPLVERRRPAHVPPPPPRIDREEDHRPLPPAA